MTTMQKAIQIGYNDTFALKCALAAKAGFRHISVNFTSVLDKTEDDWKAVTDDVARILEENGLQCIQSHPYYYDLRISSEETEERFEFAMKQAIIATGKLGGKWSVFHPVPPSPPVSAKSSLLKTTTGSFPNIWTLP